MRLFECFFSVSPRYSESTLGMPPRGYLGTVKIVVIFKSRSAYSDGDTNF